MTMASLISLYNTDMASRLRASTMNNKEHLIRTKILPYFGKMKISDIKATTVRQWQNQLLGDEYAETYLKAINNQLCAIFNYAVKYYGLKENPCHKAGSMGRKHAKEMQFWTKDEYIRFSAAIEDKPQMHVAFQVLYWCGIREGDDDDKIRLNQRKPSKYKGLRRFGPEKTCNESTNL